MLYELEFRVDETPYHFDISAKDMDEAQALASEILGRFYGEKVMGTTLFLAEPTFDPPEEGWR